MKLSSVRLLSFVLAFVLCFQFVPAWAVSSSVGPDGGSQAEGAALSTSEEASAERQENQGAAPPTEDSANEIATGDASDDAGESESTGDSLLQGTGESDVVERGGQGPKAQAPAPNASIEEGVYLVYSLLTNDKVLDIASGSLANGANVQIYSSNMTKAQQFQVAFDSDGYCTLTNVGSGKVVEVEGGVPKSGANIQQNEYNGSDEQKWLLRENENGSFAIVSKLSEDLALDIDGSGEENCTNVQLYSANGTKAQQFSFLDVAPDVPVSDEIEPGAYCIESVLDSSLAVGLSEQSRNDGVGVSLTNESASLARQFMVEVKSNGYISFRCVNSGKMLDSDGSYLTPGKRVHQWECIEQCANQEWSLRAVGDGVFTITSRSNGLALSVQGNAAKPGAEVRTYAPDGSAAQQWRLAPVERAIEDGLYTLTSALNASKAVDVRSAGGAYGTSIQLWERNNTPAQKFLLKWKSYAVLASESASDSAEGDGAVAEALTIQPMSGNNQFLTAWGDDAVSLEQPLGAEERRQLWTPVFSPSGGLCFKNVETGKMLDVSGDGTNDGCPIWSYEQNWTAAQTYYADPVAPIDDGTYVVQWLADGRALDVYDGSRADCANVQVWTRNDSGAQAWVIESAGNGYYRLLNARSQKALDVASKPWSGANVQQYAWNGTDAQLWKAVVNDDGSYSFISAFGDYALDVNGAGGYDGANVQIYESNGTVAQKWRLITSNYVPHDFEDLIGSFTTYSQNTWNGTYNMQRALDCFDGVVVQPGESVSFYGVTGRCGAAEGYLPAGVVGGIGYGGGICQASTTIYGAAIRAGFEIVDRQNHSVPSVYVPIGLDAMVSWGTSDLVIRNSTGHPVKIRTYTYDNVLTCEFWGIQADWYDYIEPISWYTSSSSAAAQRIYYKNGSSVYVEWLPSSYYW
ncbi:MAG TPA: RICIN domain-containing protein [Candidatus Aveggerthella excrementigallinarum]|nr:RICIN domain-containing protein [Candidatus Aveggerthella excrementigallinarum]